MQHLRAAWHVMWVLRAGCWDAQGLGFSNSECVAVFANTCTGFCCCSRARLLIRTMSLLELSSLRAQHELSTDVLLVSCEKAYGK